MWTVNLQSPRSQYQTCQLMYLQCQAGSKFLTITLHPPGCWNGLCCAHRQVQVPPRGILHRLRPGRRGIQHRRGCQILWRQAFMLDMLHSKDNFCTKQALFCTRQVAQDIPYHHCKTKDWVLIKGWQNTTLNDYVRSQVSIFWKVSKFTGIGVRNTGTKTVLIHVKQCYITLPSLCKMVLPKLEVSQRYICFTSAFAMIKAWHLFDCVHNKGISLCKSHIQIMLPSKQPSRFQVNSFF